MRDNDSHATRRDFLSGTIAAATASVIGPFAGRAASARAPRPAMPISFYCDDTGPYTAGTAAFRTFLDFCAEKKIKGESSLILGARGQCMTRHPDKEEEAYLEQVRRAWTCGIDSHMELMTHRGLFDFADDREPEKAIHEGLWLHEPATTVEEYEQYIHAIIEEGKRADIRFTGLTWPGCGCEACTKRYAEFRASGHSDPNPNLWQALLNLAKQGAFRGPTVPCFFGSSETKFGAMRKASGGPNAVFDLIPNAMDNFGSYTNSPDRVNADYYITADGKSGIIVRHVEQGAPYCLWYCHWQGLNPAKGVGWKAFTTVVERIRQHLSDRIVWMRPSDITNKCYKSVEK